MPLAAGTRLGPYTVVGPLAAGGMGEVYRARDERLGRDAAVKVLPEAVRADPGRLRRFEQEARAAGALSHPNVLAVYDFQAGGETPYLAAELLEGATLREHLRGGAPPLPAAVRWAAQIARGLAAAHAKGIVHRDLKPENVFVTRDGQVKILDFGLAKALDEAADPSEGGGTATADPSGALTATGAILGTAGYMAPEQVQGRAADARADVFGFGAILYELLTGARAFDGQTPVERAYAILKDEPVPIATFGVRAPPELEAIIARCLAKDPAARFPSARELLTAVETLDVPEPEGTPEAARTDRRGARRGARRALRAIVTVLALSAALAAAFAAGRASAPASAPAPASASASAPASASASVSASTRLTFRLGAVHAARFGADGHSVLYAGAIEGAPLQVFLATPGAPDARAMSPPGAHLFAISSSGELFLGLEAGDRRTRAELGATLARAPFGGGEPRSIMPDVILADFVSDAAGLAVVRRVGEALRVEHPPGRVVDEIRGWGAGGAFLALRLSPSGEQLAYIKQQPEGASLHAAAPGERPRRLAGPWPPDARGVGLAFTRDGREIWLSAPERPGGPPAIRAVDLAGRERIVARDLGAIVLQDVAADGRALVLRVDRRKRLFARAPGADRDRDVSWLDAAEPRGMTRDGGRFLFVEQGEATGGNPWIHLGKVDGSAPARLAEGEALALAPDGGWFLHRPRPADKALLLVPTGAGESFPLRADNLDVIDARWFPDGRKLLLRVRAGELRERLYAVDLDPDEGGSQPSGSPRPLTEVWTLGPAVISPDGKEIAALDGGANLHRIALSGGEDRVVMRIDRDDRLVAWIDGGKAIAVRHLVSHGLPARFDRIDLTTGDRTLWKELGPSDRLGLESLGAVEFSQDGRSWVYSAERYLSDLYLIEGLR